MKTLLTLSIIATGVAIMLNTALASPPDCNTVCTCALPCSTACSVLGGPQPTTCEAIGLACMESCPNEQLNVLPVWETGRYSDEELVCR